MKDIRPALRTLLLADPTVNALCGGRIYPVQLKQGVTNPSVVYHRITGAFDYTQAGPSGLVNSLMQFDTVSLDVDMATELGNAVHDVLSGHHGEVFFGSSSPQSSIQIHGIFQTNERDAFDTVTQMFSLQRDFLVWYWE